MNAWRLLLVLLLIVALPAPMVLSNTPEVSEEDESETPPPAPDDQEEEEEEEEQRAAESDPAGARIEGALRANSGQDQTDGLLAQLPAVAAASTPAQMAETVENIRARAGYAQIPEEFLDRQITQTSAPATEAPSLAERASESSAPAPKATERRVAVAAVEPERASSSESRTLKKTETVLPSRQEFLYLGPPSVAKEAADLAAVFRKHAESDAREGLEGKGERRAAMLKHIDALQQTVPDMTRSRVGMMPPDFAAALLQIAEQGGIDAVRALAHPDNGLDPRAYLDYLGGNAANSPIGKSAPVRRLRALEQLVQAALDSANDYEPDSKTYQKVAEIARQAEQDRQALARYLGRAVSTYPAAQATDVVQPSDLGEKLRGGMNAPPIKARFSFEGSFRPKRAVFKPTDPEPQADGGLGSTGVDLVSGKPNRLELRSVATRRMAELLGVADLVVDMRVAVLNDEKRTPGLIMEHAAGKEGMITRIEDPSDEQRQEYSTADRLVNEADGIIRFLLSDAPGALPLSAEMQKRYGDAESFDLARWRAEKTLLLTARNSIGITKVVEKLVDGTTVETLQIKSQLTELTEGDLRHPDLRRQLSNAQWLDLLCGQVDRHMGNLMIDTSGVPVVKLIDNDLAFGPNNKAYGLDVLQGTPKFRLPTKPVTIDADFQEKFLKMTEEDLRKSTEGLLNTAEQNGLVERYRLLKAYIKSGAVEKVKRPEASLKGKNLKWDAPADRLFILDPEGRIDPQGGAGKFSYYSILDAFQARNKAAGADGAQPAPSP